MLGPVEGPMPSPATPTPGVQPTWWPAAWALTPASLSVTTTPLHCIPLLLDSSQPSRPAGPGATCAVGALTLAGLVCSSGHWDPSWALA